MKENKIKPIDEVTCDYCHWSGSSDDLRPTDKYFKCAECNNDRFSTKIRGRKSKSMFEADNDKAEGVKGER